MSSASERNRLLPMQVILVCCETTLTILYRGRNCNSPLGFSTVWFLVRLASLSQPTRQVVMASGVLGTLASTKLLWQVAELEVQAGSAGAGGNGVEPGPDHHLGVGGPKACLTLCRACAGVGTSKQSRCIFVYTTLVHLLKLDK